MKQSQIKVGRIYDNGDDQHPWERLVVAIEDGRIAYWCLTCTENDSAHDPDDHGACFLEDFADWAAREVRP